MTRKGPGQEPGKASKDEDLTRRTAIKRIAAGLAGAGIVVVAGIIGQGQDRHIFEKGKYGDQSRPPTVIPRLSIKMEWQSRLTAIRRVAL